MICRRLPRKIILTCFSVFKNKQKLCLQQCTYNGSLWGKTFRRVRGINVHLCIVVETEFFHTEICYWKCKLYNSLKTSCPIDYSVTANAYFAHLYKLKDEPKYFLWSSAIFHRCFPLSLSYMETRTFWWCTCIMGLGLNLPLMLLEKISKLAVLGIQLDNSNTVLDFLSWEREGEREGEEDRQLCNNRSWPLHPSSPFTSRHLDHFKQRAKVRANLMKSFFNYGQFFVPAMDLYSN